MIVKQYECVKCNLGFKPGSECCPRCEGTEVITYYLACPICLSVSIYLLKYKQARCESCNAIFDLKEGRDTGPIPKRSNV